MDKADLPDVFGPQEVQTLRGELFVAAQHDLARRRIHDVRREDLADDFGLAHGNAADRSLGHLFQEGFVDLPALFDDQVSGRVPDVLRGLFAQKGIVHGHEELVIFNKDRLDVIEIIEDEFRGIPHGLQQDRHRHLAPAVDADVKQILGIEFQIQPGPTDGNHPGGIDELAAGQGLSLVVIEEDTGRAVELADDHPLRTVDDERPVLRHEGNFAEVDLLLLDIADLLLTRGRIDVENQQPDDDLQRRRITHPLLNALLDIIANVPDLVTHKLERAFLAIIENGKDALEGPLEAVIPPLIRRRILLKKLFVGFYLDIDKIGYIDNLPYPPEIFTKFAHIILSVWRSE